MAPAGFALRSLSSPSNGDLETAGSEALLPLMICGADIVGFVGTLICLLGAAFRFKGGRIGWMLSLTICLRFISGGGTGNFSEMV